MSYSATVAATGGTGAYTWSASGLPPGLTIGAATGTISGTLVEPDTDGIFDDPGTYQVTVTVKDASTSVSKMFSLVVVQRPLTIELSGLPAGTSGVAYSYSFNAAYGTAPYTWSASGLPAGLSVSVASGAVAQITGTPPAVTAATTYSVTVTVTDAHRGHGAGDGEPGDPPGGRLGPLTGGEAGAARVSRTRSDYEISSP